MSARMSQTGKIKAPYSAPKLTVHGTIRNMTNTNPAGAGGPDGGAGTYIS